MPSLSLLVALAICSCLILHTECSRPLIRGQCRMSQHLPASTMLLAAAQALMSRVALCPSQRRTLRWPPRAAS